MGLFGETGAEGRLRDFATAGFGDPSIQAFLPGAFRSSVTDPIFQAGIQGIGELIRNPGGLSRTVGAAIRPRLAEQSEQIAQNFRGIRSQQEGRLTRSNAPVSIRNALASALDVAEGRSQRGIQREALGETDELRRQDLGQVFSLVDAILSFMNPGRSGGIAGLGQLAQLAGQRQARNLQFTSDVIGSVAGGASGGVASASRFKEGFEAVESDEILDGIRDLPVYRWKYKGDERPHVGPMAEDFLERFGLGGDPDSIQVVDAVGTLMAATQSLARKVQRLEAVGA